VAGRHAGRRQRRRREGDPGHRRRSLCRPLHAGVGLTMHSWRIRPASSSTHARGCLGRRRGRDDQRRPLLRPAVGRRGRRLPDRGADVDPRLQDADRRGEGRRGQGVPDLHPHRRPGSRPRDRLRPAR
jgi:hypothetical protein